MIWSASLLTLCLLWAGFSWAWLKNGKTSGLLLDAKSRAEREIRKEKETTLKQRKQILGKRSGGMAISSDHGTDQEGSFVPLGWLRQKFLGRVKMGRLESEVRKNKDELESTSQAGSEAEV